MLTSGMAILTENGMTQIEIEHPVSVFDELGKVNYFGWARSDLFNFNSDLIWTPRRLITESERFMVFTQTHLFIFEINDSGLLGWLNIAAVSLIDKKISIKNEIIPFPMGGLELSSSGSLIQIKIKKSLIEFISLEDGNKILKIDINDMSHNNRLRGEVVLFKPDNAQALSVNLPLQRREECFQLLCSSPWYEVEGVMQFENVDILLSKRRAWGIHESIRLARSPNYIHFCATGCGFQNGRQIGFYLGYGIADSSGTTENAFFVNGIIHKLEKVIFKISDYDTALPWHFTTTDSRLDMNFQPVQKNMLRKYFLFSSLRLRQEYGFFSGKVTLDNGSILRFRNVTGIAERLKSTN
ncbi:hypothetical protein FACS189494_00310 [Spirochaetia bacterium]|nr:hypothetical protein FACS189494_00310 [Spirochaetia bacterium]